jgi:hypothetical protein
MLREVIIAILNALLRIEHKQDLILRGLQLQGIASPDPRPLAAMDVCPACFQPVKYIVTGSILTRTCACCSGVVHALPLVIADQSPVKGGNVRDGGDDESDAGAPDPAAPSAPLLPPTR